jgi:hypothetical protein
MEQIVRFAFETSAIVFYEKEGKSLGYSRPYQGGDGWWKCARYTEPTKQS